MFFALLIRLQRAAALAARQRETELLQLAYVIIFRVIMQICRTYSISLFLFYLLRNSIINGAFFENPARRQLP